MSLAFREARFEDIPELLRIEQLAFCSPWTKQTFYSEFLLNQHAYYILALREEKIIGYAGIWIKRSEGHITNVAIDPAHQGKMYGESLLKELLRRSKQRSVKHITLEVRKNNKRAQYLYQKLNFQKGMLRKNYYPDNGEDALIMWVNLS